MSNKTISLFDPAIMRQAAIAAFAKMNPLKLWRNPVMFATELAALYVLVLFVRELMTGGEGAAFAGQIGFWLALTVWFATFAEGVAEGRGKAQAASLRRARSELMARRLVDGKAQAPTAASDLVVGELVEVVAGELIPADGEVVEGVATVDESAITGESAPVIREAGGDRSAVTAGTRVLSDRIAVKVTATQGDTFLDRMIALVEGRVTSQDAERDRAWRLAGRSVADLRDGGRDHSGICGVFGRRRQHCGAGLPLHRADPDNHRWAALRHRHRGDGPAGALQRACHVRPRSRGCGRC